MPAQYFSDIIIGGSFTGIYRRLIMEPQEMDELVRAYLAQKRLPADPAVTFDDVIIRERISDIESRSDIKNIKARLSKNFFLNLPIVSANMDTVTDARLAIALARLGGLGFIHQFFSLEQRAEEVKKVKRADNTVIENPVTINFEATLKEAKELMARYQIASLLVVDQEGKAAGILTGRDIFFEENPDALVKNLMTSALVTAPKGISNEQAARILKEKKIEKLPLVDSGGRAVGLITAKDILKRKQFPNALRDGRGRLVVGATLRLNADYLQEARELLKAGADVLLLDTARAASTRVAFATGKIRATFPNSVLVVGNTALPEAVELLAKMGADCVKIGVGPGAACKTQEEAGVGMPQLQAIAECAAVARKLGVCLIGDGGIKSGGHLAKALVAGADAVMIGSMFAGTDEAPGKVFNEGNQMFKIYRGSASLEHQLDRMESGSLDEVRNPEGKSGRIPYAGPLRSVVATLIGGLRSSMSYVGAHDLDEFRELGTFRWRTKAAIEEGKPRI